MEETAIGYKEDVDVPKLKARRPTEKKEPADFETAISATGFGKFNFLLLAAIIPSAWSQIFEVQSIGYILPVAQCDLGLTLATKGLLNSICQMGMVSSGFFWGYLIDVFGRRRIMVYGYLIDGIFVVVAGLSQNLTMLIVAKFFGGFMINGPFSAAASLLSEFHSMDKRAKVQLVRGVWVTMGGITLPLIAWIILPWSLNLTILDAVNIHSWNVFFLFCSLMPFIASFVFYLLPESPKFLMSAGRNAEALYVFQKIYSINTGKPEDTYPIVHLKNELSDSDPSQVHDKRKGSLYVAVQRGLFNLKPLFERPMIYKLLNTCFNVFMILMGTNTMRFWMPQLLSAANDYQASHNGSSSNTCDMLGDLSSAPSSNSSVLECSVNFDNSAVYINSIIIGSAQLLGFAIVSTIVSCMGKKTIVLVILVITSICAMCIYIAPNFTVLMVTFCIFVAGSALGTNLTMTITLEIFPTKFRASALSLYLIAGRFGSITGNSIFPVLLNAGCLPPFLFLGAIMLVGAGLTALYPSTENKSLE